MDLNIPMQVPTGYDTTERTWKIGTSNLSCGLLELQGWSAGHGISTSNHTDFERDLALLCYWSVNAWNVSAGTWKDRWFSKQIPGGMIGPIGIMRMLSQFLNKGSNYLISSESTWIERFKTFVEKHNLGAFTCTEVFTNKNYYQHQIQVAVWTWNGNYPDMSLFFQPKKEVA